MPRLPSRNDLREVQLSSSQGVVRGAPPLQERAGAGLGEALAGVGMAGMAKGQEMRERKAAIDGVTAESNATIEMIRAENDLSQDNDFENLEAKYRERVTKAHGEILGTVQDPERKQLLQSRFALDFERGLGRIQNVAMSKERDYGRSTLNNLITTNREVALGTKDEAARSRLIGSTIEAVELAKSNGYLSGVEATGIRQKFTQDYALGAASMLSPNEAVQKLSGDTKGTIFDYIPADTRYKLVEQANTKMKQESALLKVSLSERVQDASAAYLEGLEFDNPPTVGEFVAAYGEEGVKRFQQLQSTKELGDKLSLVAMASPEDRRRILEESNPIKDVVGAGFADDQKRFGVLATAVQRMEKQLSEDPAAYAIKHNPEAAMAYQAMANGDEGATASYVAMMRAEQERLGVGQARLLPERFAQAVAQQFNQSPGEDAAQLIESMASQWGNDWPSVFSQLSKDLPPAALVIGSGVDPVTAELLARTSALKDDELKKGLISTDITEANKLLAEEFANFQQTMASQGNERTFGIVYGQAKRLAYAHMGRGVPYSEAVSRAYSALVDDKYTLTETYRVPKQYDFDTVSDGAAAALDSIDAKRLMVDAPAGLTDEFVAERVASNLKREGVWITSKDESGLVLSHNGAVLVDENRKPLFFKSFEELTSEGAARRTERNDRIMQDMRARR